MQQDIAISVNDVSKSFKLPHERADTVKSLFVNPFNPNRRKYEIQTALKSISFDIKEGEFFGIVGRNGSGKSTLLKIIAGIYQPNRGKVTLNGRLVPFIELGVGFNPQLTGRENVYLNGALLGFSQREVDAKYDSIVSFAELERFMDQKLRNYSSGMQVRLAFSVATVLADSDILLIDEVLAVGDADFQRKCFEYFKKLKKDKKTVVFVTHDMSAIREYCDRAILIDQNKVLFEGNPDEVAKEYTKLFLRGVYKNEGNIDRAGKGSKWGSGGIDIVDLSVSKKVYKDDDKVIKISYKIQGSRDFKDTVNPGFTIKNEQGQAICGTNTDILLGKTRKLSLDTKSNSMMVTWNVPNIFSKGRYFVDPAVLSSSNGDALQWWDDAIEFRIFNEKTTPHVVSPDITVSFE